MDQAPQISKPKIRKTLRLKIAFIIIFSVFFPYILGFFIQLSSLFFLLTLAASTIVAVVLLLFILNPLSLLLQSTSVFANGNLSYRANIKTADEFEDIGNSFNTMATQLSGIIQKIENEKIVAVTEKNKFDEILSSIIDGIIGMDFNKNIIFLNKASEQLTGFMEADALKRPIDQTIHFFSDQEEILSKTYCQESFNKVAQLVGKDGRQIKVNVTTRQVDTTLQSSLRCILIIHDLSKEEALEQMKLDFVSMASHELKTPLTSIVSYLSVFIQENRGKIPAEDLDLLGKAFTSAQQLQTLIQNLLNVNKIERDQLSVSPEPIDYLPILTKAVEDLKDQANKKNIVLNLVPPTEKLPKILADSLRITEVITNLISNAINYTNQNGKVMVTLKLSPNEITTVVADNGIGIPQVEIPHLFSKFFRVSNKLQQASKGTGLGLYISKSIIEKLHGKIWVESEVEKGSRFYFTLPVIQLTSGVLEQNRFVSEAVQSGTLNY